MPRLYVCAGTLFALLLAAPASAVTFTGNAVTLTGTSLTARPELAGDIIASKSYDIPSRNAELRTWVVRESASGTLDFYYQYANTSTTATTGLLPQIIIGGFDTGPALDVDYRTDLGTSNSVLNFAARSGDSVIFGTTLRIASIQLDAGATALPDFIHTSATAFAETGSLLITDLPEVTTGFVPASISAPGVPEPASLCLLGLSVAGLALRLSRRSAP